MADSLREALSAEDVGLLSRLGDDVVQYLDRPIADLTFNDLRDKVAAILISEGFEDARGEAVNNFGRQCEDLIDGLAPWHWGKEEPGGNE
jgi:hypothetical protein